MAKNLDTFYFRDKDVNQISAKWKFFHVILFISIAISSFISSMAAGNLFQTFRYNCILFCTTIAFEEQQIFQLSKNETLFRKNFNQTDDDDLIIFRNSTHIFRKIHDDEEMMQMRITLAKIDLKKSIFSSHYFCDYILAIQLITFIYSTFFTILMAMCSKGGKGYNNMLNRPQNMMYPILITSLLLGIFNLIATILMRNGTERFCRIFQLFTNEISCSSAINNFTIHNRQNNFYLPYIILNYFSYLIVIFLIMQFILTLLRILNVVDYEKYTLN